MTTDRREPDAADQAHSEDTMTSTAAQDPFVGDEPSATLGDSGETRPV